MDISEGATEADFCPKKAMKAELSKILPHIRFDEMEQSYIHQFVGMFEDTVFLGKLMVLFFSWKEVSFFSDWVNPNSERSQKTSR